MITSMTAYARETQKGPWGSLTWELRSVNHRYLELSSKLPDHARPLEPKIRELVQTHVQRGKIDLFLKYIPGNEAPLDFTINELLLNQLVTACKNLQAELPNAQIESTALMAWPGVLNTEIKETSALDEITLSLLAVALKNLKKTREYEGKSIEQFLLNRCALLQLEIEKVLKSAPAALSAQREKMLARSAELNIALEPDRLAQEILVWTQRADITEELQRLSMHVETVKSLLQQETIVGRKLDFLMQELNREANTLGSKSTATDITQSAVEMKVLIEQMREQVQNIE